jgi:hypothetical protein
MHSRHMKRAVFATLFSLLAVCAFAQDQTSTMTRDENIELLVRDLHAINRIATVAEDVDRSKQILLAILDSDIRTLRGPRDDGTYRWASLQREEGGRVSDEKTVEHVYTEPELRYVTLTAPNAYRMVISVPKKRGTFSENNRVWVRNVIVDSTGFDGQASHHEIPVNAWINPGDANGVAFPEIGKSVKATAELGVESGNKQAVANVALLQAKLVDDPNAPYFPAVQRLLQVRELANARGINRGQLRTTTDEALLSLPGELEKRTAEMNRAAEERKRLAESGTMRNVIQLGDATPDVIAELTEISILLNGTVQEQTEGRTRLNDMIARLKPASSQ